MRSIPLPIAAMLAILGPLMGCERRGPATSAAKESSAVVSAIEARAPELEKAIKDQKGKVVLVDCWATWCPPCVKKFPHLVKMHEQYAGQGLVCMAVSMDKYGDPDEYSKDKVVSFLKDKGADFPNFIVAEPKTDADELKKLLGDYEIIPYMALFDRNGRRVWTSDQRPRLTDDEIEKKVETVLADKP